MRRILSFSLTLLCLFSGCSKEDTPSPIFPDRTILVFMAGENSLSGFTESNLKSIISGANVSNIEKCNLLIYIDNYKQTSLYKIEKNETGVVDAVLKKTYNNEDNSADISTMRNIITDVFSTYPADEKGLFLWSHGTAWLPADLDSYLRSFGQDGDKKMEITELREALPEGFDFIIFDACYMSSVEVVYELRNKAKYILGSSTEIMGEGFPYSLVIPELLSDKPMEDRLVNTANTFYNHYNAQTGYNRTGNISLIKTSELSKLAASCRSILAGRYVQSEMIDPSPFGLKLQALEYLTTSINYSFLYDLEDYLSVFDAHIELDAVVFKATTPYSYFDKPRRSIAINKYCGLSIYVPQVRNPKMNDWYTRLEWYKDVYN